jgi:hypothetical protein
MSTCPAVRLVRYTLCAHPPKADARHGRVKARCLVRCSLLALALAGLPLWYAVRPARDAVADRGGASEVAERLAGRNGWEVHPDSNRPRHVFYLIDPKRRDPAIPLSFLRRVPAEWEGVVRIEVILTLAGEVDPVDGVVWRGLWFYGDEGMLDRVRPELP